MIEAGTLLRERRSIRKYRDEAVDRELINDAVQTAVYSPSWMNHHPVCFTVIDDKSVKETFINAAGGAAGGIVLSNKKGIGSVIHRHALWIP